MDSVYYIFVCGLLNVCLRPGFFFRATSHGRDVGQEPFMGSAVNNRLHKHLLEAKLYDGETPHSFRVGLSNTLRLLNCTQEEVAHYIGWKSVDMARHYSQLSNASTSLPILERVFSEAAELGQNPISHYDHLQPAISTVTL
jgi:hypothetical protein